MFIEMNGKRMRVFGVDVCLANHESRRLDKLAHTGPDGEMRALTDLLRHAEKVSASPSGNGHNGFGHAKKQSRPPATARVCAGVVVYPHRA